MARALTRNGKRFYPASVVHKLHTFPCKRCETCGRLISPNVREVNGAFYLESQNSFATRRFCKRGCVPKRGPGTKVVIPTPAESITAPRVAIPDDHNAEMVRRPFADLERRIFGVMQTMRGRELSIAMLRRYVRAESALELAEAANALSEKGVVSRKGSGSSRDPWIWRMP
jgi:hypothetical protein